MTRPPAAMVSVPVRFTAYAKRAVTMPGFESAPVTVTRFRWEPVWEPMVRKSWTTGADVVETIPPSEMISSPSSPRAHLQRVAEVLDRTRPGDGLGAR